MNTPPPVDDTPPPTKPTQKKKLETDPDWDQLNPEIIKLAHGNGFINQPIQLYLHGDLTWRECLETIVLLVTKEYRAQNRLLIDTLSERPNATLMLSGANGELIKALPPRPLSSEPFVNETSAVPTDTELLNTLDKEIENGIVNGVELFEEDGGLIIDTIKHGTIVGDSLRNSLHLLKQAQDA